MDLCFRFRISLFVTMPSKSMLSISDIKIVSLSHFVVREQRLSSLVWITLNQCDLLALNAKKKKMTAFVFKSWDMKKKNPFFFNWDKRYDNISSYKFALYFSPFFFFFFLICIFYNLHIYLTSKNVEYEWMNSIWKTNTNYNGQKQEWINK